MIRPGNVVTALLAIVHLLPLASPQLGVVNRAPQFLPNGDMSRFAIPEDTPPGTAVYKLSGSDPEGSRVIYSISGDHFTVDKDTGIVSTVRGFDRETQDLITVVISVTDEGIGGSEPNTVSLLREIPVLDINDNVPVFLHRPYGFALFENTPVGKSLFDNITVEDRDGGINGDVILSCSPPGDETCSIFDVSTEKVTEGRYRGVITLRRPLDYETRSSYSMIVRATDRAKDPKRRLTASANVVIDILDIQDQPPVFINAPYSATVSENTPEGTSIMRVGARDGDIGDPRTVRLEIVDDYLGYFRLRPVRDEPQVTTPASGTDSSTSYPISFYDVVTTENALDREHPDTLQNGGIYTFTIRAVELINNELPAEYSETTVTIVVRDEDDQLPVFNQDEFEIVVSEDIGLDSPLPGLNMIITDEDIGENAQYTLSLRDVRNAGDTFVVHPLTGSGRTAVVVRVRDTTRLDFDTPDEDLRTLVFDVIAGIAGKDGEREVASSRVTVHLADANDNAPRFANQSYYVSVPEDFPPDAMIHEVSATDADSREFGEIRYYLKGFGSHKFKTDRLKGGVYTSSSRLDYETQKSYNLNLIAIDGGNRTTSTNIYIDVDDVNDNKPVFDSPEYTRIIRESARVFQPEFYIRATDADGPAHGGGRIEYEIISKNHNKDVFAIDKDTGEITLTRPASSSDTPKGQYEMVVRAWDYGQPRMHEDARVNVRVGVVGNQRPYFKGNVRNPNGGPVYAVTVRENAKPGDEIRRLEAVDPDGADATLLYYLADGGKDNFVVEEMTGILKTSPYSNLDLETNPSRYELTVIAIDSGSPVPETGSTTVVVNVTDVNNKPPRFTETSYTTYVSETAELNSTVLTVNAVDPDEGHMIRYRMAKPLKVYDKAGLLSERDEDMFDIDEETGEVKVTGKLDHGRVNYVVARIIAEDVKGEEGEQSSSVEALLYVQATNEENPVFIAANWTTKTPVLRVKVNEELDKNTIVYTLRARDPVRNRTRIRYESTRNDDYDVFNVSENGNVIVLRRLDYETDRKRSYNMSVRAVVLEDVVDRSAPSKIRYTDSLLIIDIVNINDNAPVFDEDVYTRRVLESVKHPDVVLRVRANDADNDTVTYTISGESATDFVVNSTTGEISVARNVTLDRERRSVYKLNVTASDKSATSRSKIHKTTGQIVIEILDVNDNPPSFAKALYSAVVPENVNPGTAITRVLATDSDLGVSGEVRYQIIEESDAIGFFKIDEVTGEVTTNRVLTGKGRNEPYNIIIKASDRGDLALDANGRKNQKSLSSEVTLSIYVGDVIKNDGVPVFIKPTLNQVIEISENASVSTPVFQVIATDPDDANSAEGQIRYKFLDDGKSGDENPFKIHFESGLISTRLPLDREVKSSYDVIIVAHDLGEVPQQATRVLHIEILDVDDHKPHFRRSIDEAPMTVKVVEETDIGSEIGFVQAIDEDTGDNAKIDYVISYGNEENLFSITRTEDNVGVLITNGRLDREKTDHHLITVKCHKLSEDGRKLNYIRPYNRQDPSERQILIKVVDIDDNNPEFEHKNLSIGVRLNVPPETTLLTLRANDIDADSAPIEYYIRNVTFTRLARLDPHRITDMMDREERIFHVDERTGELKTINSIQNFGDGYFDLVISANNTKDVSKRANMTVKIFMLRDRGLLKFVFNDPPVEVKKRIPELESAVASALQLPGARVNVYDTQFHAKKDGSLDFSSTSSCFQIIGKEPFTIKEMEKLMSDPKNKNLKRVFTKFNVEEVGRCASVTSKAEASWVEIWVLVISALIGVFAIIAACTICCLYRRYKKDMKRRLARSEIQSQPDYMTIRSGARSSSVLGSQLIIPPSQMSGSHMYINKSDRSVLGSQILKGSTLAINQPATQLGSQLIINNPKTSYTPTPSGYGERTPVPGGGVASGATGPIIMGSSQMLVPNNTTIINEGGGYDEQSHMFGGDDLGSQVMYEYVGDGADNMAFEDNS